jgi:hypothetical protein
MITVHIFNIILLSACSILSIVFAVEKKRPSNVVPVLTGFTSSGGNKPRINDCRNR